MRIGILVLALGFIVGVFANDAVDSHQNKHDKLNNYFGVNLGSGFAKNVFTADFGVSYDFYALDRLSINTGILFHYNRRSGNEDTDANANPLCFTIPFGVHFNMLKNELLYTGMNIFINIPIWDLDVPEKQNAYTKKDVFVSLPIDFGFDMIKSGKGGSRLFFRISPTFNNKGKTSVPIGLVWQVYNWKIKAKKVEINVVVPVVDPIIILID